MSGTEGERGGGGGEQGGIQKIRLGRANSGFQKCRGGKAWGGGGSLTDCKESVGIILANEQKLKFCVLFYSLVFSSSFSQTLKELSGEGLAGT